MKVILLLVISWLIPGSGYWFLGKARKYIGLLIFGLLSLLILTGMLVADFRDVRFVDNPFYYMGRFGSGLTWLITIFILSSTPAGIIPYQYFDIGHLYLCVAGALNVVVILNMLSAVYKVIPHLWRGSPSAATQSLPAEASAQAGMEMPSESARPKSPPG